MRMNLNYTYIWFMKSRLNLTIENSLLEDVKSYAVKQKRSVSDLVESYFKKVTRPSKRKNIIDLVEKLEKSTIDKNADLKDLYYKENAKKYGVDPADVTAATKSNGWESKYRKSGGDSGKNYVQGPDGITYEITE